MRFYHPAIAAFAAVAAFLFLALPAGAQVTVDVNGTAMDFSTAPIIQDGRVFVPLRGVFEQLGASVDYSSGTITATGTGGRTIALQIGSTQATIDGQAETIDVAPFIVNETTFVPLRFISQALGANVDWDNANRVVSISLAGAPAGVTYTNAPVSDEYADAPPPPIPAYDQPYVPAPNEIWQPGYWAWGVYGYYWVPGTWVEPPQTGYLWTPGYWAWANNRYAWNGGYWATAVGFYGGVNYGAGYYGNGYNGGRWQNGAFRYNTYVSHVNTTIVNNVYVDRTVIVNNTTINRVSYNGGPRGLAVRPSAQQLAVAQAPHLALTPVQRQHVLVASQDRRLLATVNHNNPPVAAVARPLSAANPPAGFVRVTAADRVAPPVEHAAPAAAHVAPPAQHTAPSAAYVPPVEHAAPPVEHVAPAPAHSAAPPAEVAKPVHYAAPVEHVAPPVEHVVAPVEHVAPPVQHAAPTVHVAPPPVQHAAPPAPPAMHVAPPPHAPAAPHPPAAKPEPHPTAH